MHSQVLPALASGVQSALRRRFRHVGCAPGCGKVRQRQVPDAPLGQVTSLHFTVTRGAEALGAMTGGALAAIAGIRAPMLLGAVPIAVVTVLLCWRHRKPAGSAATEG
jgi:hypothetical protein